MLNHNDLTILVPRVWMLCYHWWRQWLVTYLPPSHQLYQCWPVTSSTSCIDIPGEILSYFRARSLSLAWSKLRLCSANHRPGYLCNLACDWLSIVWAYSADDTTMISSMYTFTSVMRQDTACIVDNINEELSKISDWLAVNKLSLNTSKTKFIQFHHRQKTLNENDYLKLRINNSEIERVQEFNFLGLTINEYLDWSSHCNNIAFKISRTLGIMNRLKHELPSIILKLMYDALIMSHFQYCVTSWGYSCYRLFKLQKRAIRIVTLSKYNADTDPLFKLNKLLKIDDIFKIQCLKLYYKYRKAILPKYLFDMFTENCDVHNHNTRQTSHLHHGVTRTVSARNCVRYFYQS